MTPRCCSRPEALVAKRDACQGCSAGGSSRAAVRRRTLAAFPASSSSGRKHTARRTCNLRGICPQLRPPPAAAACARCSLRRSPAADMPPAMVQVPHAMGMLAWRRAGLALLLACSAAQLAAALDTCQPRRPQCPQADQCCAVWVRPWGALHAGFHSLFCSMNSKGCNRFNVMPHGHPRLPLHHLCCRASAAQARTIASKATAQEGRAWAQQSCLIASPWSPQLQSRRHRHRCAARHHHRCAARRHRPFNRWVSAIAHCMRQCTLAERQTRLAPVHCVEHVHTHTHTHVNS